MCDNGFQKIYHPIRLSQKTKCETTITFNPKLDKTKLKGITIPYGASGNRY